MQTCHRNSASVRQRHVMQRWTKRAHFSAARKSGTINITPLAADHTVKELATYLLIHGASYASLLGLYFSVLPLSEERSTGHWVILLIAACLVAFLLVRGATRAWQERSRVYKGTDAINAYMSRWVSQSGRTVILSRDMSWGSQPTAKAALLQKAKADELIILMHTRTALVAELDAAGAEIIEYSAMGHQPRSRFTIIGFGKDGGKVAIGTTSGDDHRVVEYRSGEHPAFAIADDLVRFLLGAVGK